MEGSRHFGTCYHCGEPLPAAPVQAEADGQTQAFCCQGCAAAAEWIRQADLQGYYRLRSAAAARVGTEPLDLGVWDREEVLAEHSHAIEGGREITLLTDGMRCAACAWLIDRALAREPGVLDSSANAVTGRIRIAWDPARTALSQPLARLAMLGYRPYLAGGQAREQARQAERRRWLLRLGVAGLGALQAMMLAEALYLDVGRTMSIPTRDFFRWLTFLLSTPVVFYAGWPFLEGAWRELRNRQLGMDTLIAGSTLLAYFASLIETVRGGPHVWYDAAVMFVFLLLAARMLEQRARNIATSQVDALARARPAFATRENDDGSRQSVPVSALLAGDVVRVAEGDGVPADGVLLSDQAAFEEALLTGESAPVQKRAGADVYAGTLCLQRPARLQVTQTGAGTRLSQLARLVEQAQAHRPPIARLADRIGSRFVRALLLSAVAIFVFWRWHDPARAFEVTLAWLVISCPCALSLSVPAALAAAHGTLARWGVLATRADALDSLAQATDIVFDKTGTLTDAQPALAGVQALGDISEHEALRIAAALERDSRHPIAAAFRGVQTGSASEVETVAGHGVIGIVDGRRWRLGTAAFACGETCGDGLWLGDGRRAQARFELAEQLRPDAYQAIAALRGSGLSVHLASGDQAGAVARTAAALGVASAHARQLPEQKLARVRELQAAGRVVAMVGDGLNDAPVLAGADVSIAMGEGAPLAQHAADLVVTGNVLSRIPAAIALARKTRRVIRQNLAWAVAYNLVALPLAAAGLVTPWVAALGMALSSLTVTVNALRLARTADGMPADGVPSDSMPSSSRLPGSMLPEDLLPTTVSADGPSETRAHQKSLATP
ncbi:heavy metal translocating P-type ATPase [Pseudoxanthomonas wuyuanensis]|uniref:Cu2+-exporting ATPase n=1 Tax=Pseudoxanthomonas wuyuanensis TaxID=1073196 RepID=A0A286DGK0_9GAMM|nr:heavy metal translocating P-type ATPase [Pseudoxanthomonas wuyuanensis]KAF1717205.1 heavy metal translocating P-type ATPase [Pseudoxanthomonas wuyuanensis]SOD57875.1 Cu2+-exporting ATPase [Pseudoxanthomonas wuyuanensis]